MTLSLYRYRYNPIYAYKTATTQFGRFFRGNTVHSSSFIVGWDAWALAPRPPALASILSKTMDLKGWQKHRRTCSYSRDKYQPENGRTAPHRSCTMRRSSRSVLASASISRSSRCCRPWGNSKCNGDTGICTISVVYIPEPSTPCIAPQTPRRRSTSRNSH